MVEWIMGWGGVVVGVVPEYTDLFGANVYESAYFNKNVHHKF